MTSAGPLLDEVTDALRLDLDASRVTLRVDVPENPFFPILAESLAPGVASLRGETLRELRRSGPFIYLVEHRKPLVQDDVLTSEVDARAVLELFGFRSQVLVPLLTGDEVTGFLSVHREGEPHVWTEAEVARAVAATTEAQQILAANR